MRKHDKNIYYFLELFDKNRVMYSKFIIIYNINLLISFRYIKNYESNNYIIILNGSITTII